MVSDKNIRKHLDRKLSLLHKLRDMDEPFIESTGLKDSQLDCLLYLGSCGYNSSSKGVKKGEVGNYLGPTRDISRIIIRLEKEGLVEELNYHNHSSMEDSDRRVRMVRLSKKGEKLYQKALNCCS